MLYRETIGGRIAITQPTHAWLCGQLARAWGNDLFGHVAPREEVCLGAELHDIGHNAWEQAPTLNQETGLPYSFFELPRPLHLQIWSTAARLVLPLGRYPALLVSLQGTGLYENYYDATKETPENAQAVQNYLSQERAFQQEVLASLRADPHYAPSTTKEAVARNQRLIQVWDALSLAICFGSRQIKPIPHVPTATGMTTLALTARDDDPTQLIVTPWPFQSARVTLIYEGRSLESTFSDETMMREAVKRASWVTLQTTLIPDEHRGSLSEN